ncbi:MAG: hypothetical protein AAGA76_06495 [Pseudomonadota bacterium]
MSANHRYPTGILALYASFLLASTTPAQSEGIGGMSSQAYDSVLEDLALFGFGLFIIFACYYYYQIVRTKRSMCKEKIDESKVKDNSEDSD